MMKPLILSKKFTNEEVEEIRKQWEAAPVKINLDAEFIEIDRLNRELEAAATYIEENEVIHLKTKKNIPTVIQYQGKRYVLDHRGDK